MGLTFSIPLIAKEAVKPITQHETKSFSNLIGKGLLIGVGAAGICAILYNRITSPRNGIIDEEVFHEEHVVSRVKQTLYYWIGSLGIATLSCATCSLLIPSVLDSSKSISFLSVCTITIITLFSGVWVQGLPYKPGFGLKQIAWITHSAIVGAVFAPLIMIEKFILAKSAGVTFILVGELTFLAICCHHITFLSLGLLVPLGTVCLMLSTIANYIWSPSTIFGAILLGFIIHGGFIIVSIHVLYDTQALAAYALWCNREGSVLFDPVNASIDLFIDTVKIFLRVTAIMCIVKASESATKSG